MKAELGFLACVVLANSLAASASLAPQKTRPAPSVPRNQAERQVPGPGYSVASAGDVNGDGYGDLILGVRELHGSVLVHFGAPGGIDSQLYWQVWGEQPGGHFGGSVAGVGDVNGDGFDDVLVGARDQESGEAQEGRALLYLGSASGPAPVPDWSVEGGQADAALGTAVAGAGDVNGDGFDDVLVGAPKFDDGERDEGRVQLHLGSATGLAATPAWWSTGDQAFAELGSAVAGVGDVNADGFDDVLVGAERYDGSHPDGGRASLYLGSAAGLAASPAWTAEGEQEGASFAQSVAGAGDVNGDGFDDLLIGAPLADGGPAGEGRVFVYLGSPTGPAAVPDWTVNGGQAQARLGWSVAGAGDVNADGYDDVVLGAPGFDEDGRDVGRAQVHLGSAAGLAVEPTWTGLGDVENALVGLAVSAAGDVEADGHADVLVASADGRAGNLAFGRVSLEKGIPPGLDPEPSWSVVCEQTNAGSFGASVNDAGDVNGDGFHDLIIGVRDDFNDLGVQVGRVYVHLGSASGPAQDAAWIAEGDQYFGLFGWCASGAGDVNGDGYDDVIVSEPSRDQSEISIGRVHVFHGSAAGLSATADWITDGNPFSLLRAVSGAGDVNGDGYGDVIVGDQGYETAYVYLGSAQGLASGGTRLTHTNSARYGYAVAGAGDVNGDGYDDVLVGDYYLYGKVYAYLGSPSGTDPSWSWLIQGSYYGSQVAGAGDVNGDGFADVLYSVGLGSSSPGEVYLHLGSPSGPALVASWSVAGDHDRALLGSSLSAGDVDADGYSDVLLGAPGYNGSATESVAGWVYLYRGSAAGLTLTPSWAREWGEPLALFGASLDAIDANGDGHSDLLVGAPGKLPPVLHPGGYPGRVLFFESEPVGGIAGLCVAPGNATDPAAGQARRR
jgi:FG-GAP repeat protein/VCBS repeat protein